jgi:hypothetical protein
MSGCSDCTSALLEGLGYQEIPAHPLVPSAGQ